ncbi:hypothetical protein [Streptomyces aurantiogriseus]|uniref:Uncharacterized protein n=1 Tax=Streptomyces aurantiogriseus TaxID=66870 RepID=A0A918CMT2_9ACTN|nr:hypothetical protein [Streptomyces aurantiogriseus]GGR29181.1 hypothetical protein GCM10010251_51760 [Streptomyces aurantiogriseus]
MTRSDDHGGEASERELGLWIAEIPAVLREMRAEVLPEDFPFDFRAASLEALEAFLLDAYRSADEKVGMDFRPTVCAMVYLGEVLLGVGGGRWDWEPRKVRGSSTGRPVVRPDPALGLGPVSPLALIARATRTRTGRVLTDEVAGLQDAVARRQEQAPGWKPVTTLHPEQAAHRTGAEHPELTRWLDRRAEEFPAWAQEAGAAGPWDFSPESLDRLEAVLRDRFADSAAILAAKSGSFVQGAVWYVGEVVRRTRDGVVWQYRPRTQFDEPLEAAMFHADEIYLDTPRVAQPGLPDGGSAYPMALLNVLFWETDELDNPIEPRLVDFLDDFAG